MKHVEDVLDAVGQKLDQLAEGNAVVARPQSVGNKHILPLCELSIGFGGGGGMGEGGDTKGKQGTGLGGGAGGNAKARPVAVLVIDEGKVRVENLTS
jgi:uncharacterized spore protein YtfJ